MGLWVVAAIAAVGIGLGVASILGAVRGAHLDETGAGSHRFARVLVGVGYIALAALILFAVINANR